jgi:hypothetical protein
LLLIKQALKARSLQQQQQQRQQQQLKSLMPNLASQYVVAVTPSMLCLCPISHQKLGLRQRQHSAHTSQHLRSIAEGPSALCLQPHVKVLAGSPQLLFQCLAVQT